MDALHQARQHVARREWKDAFAAFGSADRVESLQPEDRERWCVAAMLIGRDADCIAQLARAHQDFLTQDNPSAATRCAFWLGMKLMDQGDHAQATGWLARARRVLDDAGVDCVEKGYLLVPQGMQQLGSGDVVGAHNTFEQALATARRFGDRDLEILARHEQGRSLIQQGRVRDGVALLDEAMVGVTAGDASPVIAGIVYCSVLSACQEIYDWRRAREWTAALTQWCAAQPDLVAFRGECRVRRAEILRQRGAWLDAMEEAERANDAVAPGASPTVVGAALYQLAELHRLRGDFAGAEAAFRQGGQWSRRPQPGPALLRLAQGQIDAARAAIQRILQETADRRARAAALGPCAEIMLAAGDRDAAGEAASELAVLAAELDAPVLHAVAAYATGAVHLAAGEPQRALGSLRTAWGTWIELDAPYEVARTRVLIGLACRQLGDHDAARLEFEAARHTFQVLGAAPDLAHIDMLGRKADNAAPGGLTAREVQVLRLLASGKTNRAIAQDLAISEKTVARHVSNIFLKLGVESRSSATAYAYQHGFA